MDKTVRLIARIVGGISLAFGIASAILAVWAIDRQFAIGGIVQISAAAAVVGFLLISAFCCLVEPQRQKPRIIHWCVVR